MPKFKPVIEKRISSKYSDEERKAITRDVVSFIRKQTASGKDWHNNDFKAYKSTYSKSTVFKESGKSPTKVNLKLTGDMLDDIGGLEGSTGRIRFGFGDGASSESLGKAEGHVTGKLGANTTGRTRDFLGISRDNLRNILNRYPLDDMEAREDRTRIVNLIADLSSKSVVADKVAGEIALGTIAASEAAALVAEKFSVSVAEAKELINGV